MILQLGEGRAVELGVAADVSLGIDQRDAPSQARAGERRELRPAARIGRGDFREQARLALQLSCDFLFQMTTQQDIGRDDRADDRGSHEQSDAREQPRGELHGRRRAAGLVAFAGGAGGSRKR